MSEVHACCLRRRIIDEGGNYLPPNEITYDAVFLVSDSLDDDEEHLVEIAAGLKHLFPPKSSYDDPFLGSTLGHPKLTEYHQLWVEPIGLDEVLDGLARSGHFKHMKTLFGIGRDELQGRKIREEAKRKGRHLALFQAISHKVLGPRKQAQKSWLDDLGIYTPCVPTWVPIYDPDDFCINYSSLVERKPNKIQPLGSPLKWDHFPSQSQFPSSYPKRPR